MLTAFILLFALGLMLLVMLPHSKNRAQRIATRGGAAMLFGLGLFGSVFAMMAG
ncbi:hypothetical protein [Aurantiacibacter spongiae]|uniref:hypothetical protein n=1 Tax=Aurantiacibacter spongiae TaxID=2488860 RepID=UPI0013156885|nr:hypothetical protein [Aurantiacibacter spongiae]